MKNGKMKASKAGAKKTGSKKVTAFGARGAKAAFGGGGPRTKTPL
jgi:hypothetical protein